MPVVVGVSTVRRVRAFVRPPFPSVPRTSMDQKRVGDGELRSVLVARSGYNGERRVAYASRTSEEAAAEAARRKAARERLLIRCTQSLAVYETSDVAHVAVVIADALLASLDANVPPACGRDVSARLMRGGT